MLPARRRLATPSLLILLMLASAPARAQEPDGKLDPAQDPTLIQRNKELEEAQQARQAASAREAKLREEIASIGRDRKALNQRLIETAARISKIEASITASEQRLKPLDARERTIRDGLAERQAETVEVLAALQRAGRRMPPALFVRPEDALASLRTAMLLGAVLPDMRAKADRLIADLDNLIQVRRNIAQERDRLKADREALSADQQKVSLLVEARQKQLAETERELAAEQARAQDLARQVDNLKDLIARLEKDLKSAAEAAKSASLKGTPDATKPAAPGDAGRLAPAVAFADARGLLPMPVSGLKMHEFGDADGVGGRHRGLSIATRAGAQVTAPSDGWVVYAGPFRSYGQLLILNAGGGYHVLLAGMERISVNIGQFVVTGEPVATMGTGARVAAILATAPSQPVLYIEFRKDGTPIDPGPWWATGKSEKVRG